MFAELGACLANGCLHVCGIVRMYAELGACLGNGCLHVCGIGCMYAELGACLGKRLLARMRNWVHVCRVGCMSGKRLLACMWNWVHVCGVGCMYAELGAKPHAKQAKILDCHIEKNLSRKMHTPQASNGSTRGAHCDMQVHAFVIRQIVTARYRRASEHI